MRIYEETEKTRSMRRKHLSTGSRQIKTKRTKKSELLQIVQKLPEDEQVLECFIGFIKEMLI